MTPEGGAWCQAYPCAAFTSSKKHHSAKNQALRPVAGKISNAIRVLLHVRVRSDCEACWPGLKATANVGLGLCVRVLDGTWSVLLVGTVRVKLEKFYRYRMNSNSDKLDQYGFGRSGAGRNGLVPLQYLSIRQGSVNSVA